MMMKFLIMIDDGNGYIDDIHGWDYVTDNPDPFEDSLDSHGISIAGIIVDDTVLKSG